MAINPIAFGRAVNEQFLRYQLTAFPLADETLARQVEESIRGGGARPTPLIKGPYLSLVSWGTWQPIYLCARNAVTMPRQARLDAPGTLHHAQVQSLG